MRLNLGSYASPLKDYHNVDIVPWPGVDEVWNLNMRPWPWQLCEEVRAIDIFEHIDKLSKREIVRELARIMIMGGVAVVRVPCGSHPYAWASIQHAHLFWFNSFEGPNYAQPYFKVRKIYAGFWNTYTDIPYNRLTRPFIRVLARMTLVHTITFHLEKISDV